MFIVSLPFAVLRGGYWAILAMVGIAHICCYTGKILVDCLYEEVDVYEGDENSGALPQQQPAPGSGPPPRPPPPPQQRSAVQHEHHHRRPGRRRPARRYLRPWPFPADGARRTPGNPADAIGFTSGTFRIASPAPAAANSPPATAPPPRAYRPDR